MSSASETTNSDVVVPETNSDLKTLFVKLNTEGTLSFYIHGTNNDELLRSFRKKVKELNISPYAKFLVWHNCLYMDINTTDLLSRVAKVEPQIWVSVSAEDNPESLPNSWTEMFYGRTKQTLPKTSDDTTCCRSRSWNRSHSRKINHRLPRSRVGSTVDCCRYHGVHPECHIGSSPCFEPYYEYLPLFCHQCSFYSLCPHCLYLETLCSYDQCGSACNQCYSYYY